MAGYRGIAGTKRYELATLGIAHAIHAGTNLYGTDTILTFFSAEEHAGLAQKAMKRRPNFLNAKVIVQLTVSVGNDLAKAQEVADQVNVYRQDYICADPNNRLSVRDVEREISIRVIRAVVFLALVIGLGSVLMNLLRHG